jgi:hypothetical protein
MNSRGLRVGNNYYKILKFIKKIKYRIKIKRLEYDYYKLNLNNIIIRDKL